jgi:demethylmenaquinone methyltransferase/2-methoxy-6-polyprenyl-1,4-benzoquinol methylase
MFGRIAQRYDLMNHLMTLGRDSAWRRYAAKQAAVPERGRVLDIATGTGDLAMEALSQQPQARAVGLDFTPKMLDLAQEKSRAAGVPLDLVAGDALHLPFAHATFDAVVTGFALRNVTDIPAAFGEMARVVCPGGRVACLEIAKPTQPLLRRLFALYFYRLVPLLGGWITGERSAYTYLPHSLTSFLTPDEIVDVMRQTGWHKVRYRRMMLGTVAVHTGVRAGSGATSWRGKSGDSQLCKH